MTTPPDGFRAHDHGSAAARYLQQSLDAVAKSFGLHVIGIAAKRFVAPGEVQRVRSCAATPAEFGKMLVVNCGFGQRRFQVCFVKLRITLRAGKAAYVG